MGFSVVTFPSLFRRSSLQKTPTMRNDRDRLRTMFRLVGHAGTEALRKLRNIARKSMRRDHRRTRSHDSAYKLSTHCSGRLAERAAEAESRKFPRYLENTRMDGKNFQVPEFLFHQLRRARSYARRRRLSTRVPCVVNPLCARK